ncbi:CCA tRNA nucleotidyltransferase [Jeotgalibacillus proteolyticus]|uniref:CCA-adding enzyme n=1 Tax=Jeotgalibacillus proteolyticus TaxID=2082395 RepID=A0A2S5GEE3_9BACL|nr:CCA tRNA nucleotidyltransferase [Jeotgalibacillus proteolyticus]PPA71243.1 CCA tRNA nucleotidyltransferase [Jeotgalibacillus proteolyticus]
MKLPSPFTEALPILIKLIDAGFEAYFVGGCVRDFLLKRTINDVDIATSATPAEVTSLFENTVEVGIDHGTVMVIYKGKGFEVTTFRSEGTYSDFRRPDEVSFVLSLEEDLKRRDFTINAMAMTVDLSLIDLFEGRADLKRKQIATVGEAAERFGEDALRMLRGARFSAQLHFSIDDKTKEAMKQHAPLLKHVAVERKRMEMDKLLAGSASEKGLSYLLETGLVRHLPFFPLSAHIIKEISDMDLEALSIDQRWSLLSILFIVEDTEAFLKEWRLSNKRIAYIKKLTELYHLRALEDWEPYRVYHAGESISLETEMLYSVIHHQPADKSKIQEIWEALPIKDKSELDVNGRDLVSWSGRKSGRWVGDALQKIERAVIEKELLNDKIEIKKWVKQWLQK